MVTFRLLWIANDSARLRQTWMDAAPHEVYYEFTPSLEEGLARLRLDRKDVVLVTNPVESARPEEVLEAIHQTAPEVPVVVQLEKEDSRTAFRLAQWGIHEVVPADCPPGELWESLEEAARAHTGDPLGGEPWREGLVGASAAMAPVFERIRLVGPKRATVLLTGETGTGKEVVARAFHLASPRSAQPLVAVNCTALPEHLLEAELFGHTKGAFTGAVNPRVGRFEQANHGTLFLDEIGDMPLEVQAKLLRVLQEREFQRLGSSETLKTDVRVIAATHVDLEQRMASGKFREDLYYRLNVVPVSIPPLRERRSDIVLLAAHFLGRICEREDQEVKTVTTEAMRRLSQFDWPGNVRQLENALEQAVALSGDRCWLGPGDFPLCARSVREPQATTGLRLTEEGIDFTRMVGALERSLLDQALRLSGGNKKKAADILNLKRTTFSAKLRSLEMAGGR